jgi:hypothetical protein
MTKDQTGPGGYYHMLCTYIPCNFLLVKGQRAPFVGQQLQVFGASFSQRGHDGKFASAAQPAVVPTPVQLKVEYGSKVAFPAHNRRGGEEEDDRDAGSMYEITWWLFWFNLSMGKFSQGWRGWKRNPAHRVHCMKNNDIRWRKWGWRWYYRLTISMLGTTCTGCSSSGRSCFVLPLGLTTM